jgi:Cu2+-exporting ATPase
MVTMLLSSLGILVGVYLSKTVVDALPLRRNIKKQSDKSALTEEKRDASQHLYQAKMGGASVVIVSVGYFYPPLRVLGIAVVSYNILPIFKRAFHEWQSDKKIGNESYSAFVPTLLLGMNNVVVAGVHNIFYHTSHYLIAQSRENSTELAIDAYHDVPKRVWVMVGSIETQIPLDQVNIGDAVIITTGETIPIDGVISTGYALIDQQALTGEANPVEKNQGEAVMAATIVLSGRIVIHASQSGKETRIDKLNALLHQTRDFKTQLQLKGEAWADRIALPAMLTSAALVPFIGMSSAAALLFTPPTNTMRSMLSVQTSAHLQWITKQGVLIKDGRILEELTNIDIILFDKTGTLTETHPDVVSIICCAERDEDNLLVLAAAAEQRQEHPIAKAIINKAKEKKLSLPQVAHSHYDLGKGITVQIDGQDVKVGSLRFIQEAMGDTTLPIALESAMQAAIGHTFILIAVDGKLQGALELHPRLRPEVPQLIRDLRQRGFKQLAIVSGDQKVVTNRLAQQLKLDRAYGEVLPEGKAALIKQLQDEGHHVCFIGDGLNDAIALKQANVSVCLSSASGISSDVAQVIMLNDTLAPFDHLFDMATHLETGLKNSMRVWIAFGVSNALAVPFLGFGVAQSSLLYGTAFVSGLKLSKVLPKEDAIK